MGVKHSSDVEWKIPKKTFHGIFIEDAISFLKKIPDSSIQLVLLDPPYNLDITYWDTFSNYMQWAKQWLDEISRILRPSGNAVIFGGFQYRDIKKGDLLEITHYLRHETSLLFVNMIIWYYRNGQSAHRFFANRHEEILWYAKTKKYYFDLDAVRIKYDEKTKKLYKKDKRLNPETIEKGKNPTNVWLINRLNSNAKERVGHPTQKPIKLIKRLVKGLSYPGSIVLDFFAGSGTTGRACIEEDRHSILVDNNSNLYMYLNKHIENMKIYNNVNSYEILNNFSLEEYFQKVKTDKNGN